jgi:ABC-type branched-subunit amino acid transport system permease subunit
VVAVSSGLAAIGGALLAGLRTSAGAADFAMFQSLLVLLLIVIGGVTTISGALTGGLFFALFPYVQQQLLPSLSGFVFLGTALAGIGVARRPNGMAYDLAHQAERVTGWIRSVVHSVPATDQVAARITEEVVR